MGPRFQQPRPRPPARTRRQLRHREGSLLPGPPLLSLPPVCRPQSAPSRAKHRADAHPPIGHLQSSARLAVFNERPPRPRSGLSRPQTSTRQHARPQAPVHRWAPAPTASRGPPIVPGSPPHPQPRDGGLQITQAASPPWASYLSLERAPWVPPALLNPGQASRGGGPRWCREDLVASQAVPLPSSVPLSKCLRNPGLGAYVSK